MKWFNSIWNDPVVSKLLAAWIDRAAIFLIACFMGAIFSKGIFQIICTALSAVMLISILLYVFWKRFNFDFNISTPVVFEKVTTPITVNGTYNKAPSKGKLMIIVFNSIKNEYWPKNEVTLDNINKKWQSKITIEGGYNENRIIIVACLKPSAQELVNFYIRAGSSIAIPNNKIMNENIKILAQVTVTIEAK
ncbi:hypothetical protein [uncultured Mucilaginibacter sp.]|uniref:hypothetical protein n=1 Tax=uncultured Mucilaginibacter sp. TaxID=797541 RepID=UPI002627FC02|nr:hypothetical protein [uncultured Mucilaginibacter sp.]